MSLTKYTKNIQHADNSRCTWENEGGRNVVDRAWHSSPACGAGVPATYVLHTACIGINMELLL
jgi:hypothetical protein